MPNFAIPSSFKSHYCTGETIFLEENGKQGVLWSWTGPNGFVSNEQDPVILNASAAHEGEYSVTVTNAFGCHFSSTVDITVSEATADAGDDVCIEPGESVQMMGQGMGTSFQWSPTTGLSNSTILNPVANPATTTTYLLTCLLYTSPSPRDRQKSRMPSSA